MMNLIKSFENWYRKQCDGNWEHNYGITIQTLDNPGWVVEIDLNNTEHENLQVEKNVENSEFDWFSITIKDRKLIASGDALKLEVLLIEASKLLGM